MASKMVPFSEEVNSLFANSDANEVWDKAASIILLINPDCDLAPMRAVFDDMVALFHGEYPAYAPVKTLYHDLAHTLHVFLCAVRLMHGVHVSGTPLRDEDVVLVMTAALMHDIGYAQASNEEAGTGAQYTLCHVSRGIEFMHNYLAAKGWPADLATRIEPLIRATDPSFPFAQIAFADEHQRLLGQLVATADLVGQMADRTYLEKLLFLYLEFKEAHFGNYQNVHDMLRQTKRFYDLTREKLDVVYGGVYARLSAHFRVTMGVGNNYYLESIEKNIDYLARVTQLEEAEHFTMLKRGGIADKAKTLPDFQAPQG
ncbi:MAG TPA: HD domain-containing protein [Gallionella sp.]|nr:HD domain-containing protein [Gallionella sp.]